LTQMEGLEGPKQGRGIKSTVFGQVYLRFESQKEEEKGGRVSQGSWDILRHLLWEGSSEKEDETVAEELKGRRSMKKARNSSTKPEKAENGHRERKIGKRPKKFKSRKRGGGRRKPVEV